MLYVTEISLWKTIAAKQYALSEIKEVEGCFQVG